MAANTAGTLNYDTKMDTKGAESGISSISSKTIAMGNLMADAIEKVAGKIFDLGKQALESYAQYEQLTGGVSKLFGTAGMSLEQYANSVGKSVDEARKDYDKLTVAQDKVLENSKNAYKTAGLSANAYMETVTGFSASLIGSLGGDTVKAADYADRAIRDMSDNANTFGTDISQIQSAYQGFAKQNYTIKLMSA